MALELICKTCGQPFTPSRKDMLAGPGVYRTCPACRKAGSARDDEPPAGMPGAHRERRTRNNTPMQVYHPAIGICR